MVENLLDIVHLFNQSYVVRFASYRIAGNFRGVQIFAFFEDAHFSAKLKYRHSCYLEDRRTGIDRTQCSACMQLTANN